MIKTAADANAEKALVVLPTYNEKENLETAVRAVRDAGFDVLVVDDGSPDGTGEIADALALADPGVTVLHRSRKLGLGTAYVEGFRIGLDRGFGYLVEMDADGSHKPRHLPDVVAAARTGGGIGIGSRYVRGGLITGWSARRRWLSWGANVYCRAVLGLRVHDATTGYRCYPRSFLEAIDLQQVISEGYSFQVEMLYRAARLGVPIVEVPIHFEDRVAGASKVSGGEIWDDFFAVLKIRLRDGRRR